jgi:ABC-type multidrug transport system fused ATPase/permease subunit
VVSCGIAQAGALAVAAFATRDAFSALHAGHSIGLQTIAELAFAGVFAAFCHYLSRKRAEALGQSYAICVRRVLYQQIAGLPKARHDQRRVGALSLRFVSDLSAARLWFGRGLPDILSAAVVLPGAMTILFLLDPSLAVAGVIPLGLTLVLMIAIAWHLELRHRRLRRRRASIAIGMIERITIAPDLDLMGRTNRELRSLNEKGAALRSDAVARRGRTVGLQAVLQVGLAFAGLSILWAASQAGVAPAIVAASLSVLALIALPLQDIAGAWDRYCGWRVAREKARHLLAEPTVQRTSKRGSEAATVQVSGMIGGAPIDFHAPASEVTVLKNLQAYQIARCISGLDHDARLTVAFNTDLPSTAHIGDTHVGLQGSLRRSATLMSQKRPDDARIKQVLKAFGLGELLSNPRGLDQRLAENGKGLTPAQTLRLELARAVIGDVPLIVIASLRWQSEADRAGLIEKLRRLSGATIILAEQQTTTTSFESPKAS